MLGRLDGRSYYLEENLIVYGTYDNDSDSDA